MTVAIEELPEFFSRNDLSVDSIQLCLSFVAEHFPSHNVLPVSQQGGCSYTLVVTTQAREPMRCPVIHGTDEEGELEEKTIVQFRLLKHALPMHIAMAASRHYPSFAPTTRELGHITVGEDVTLQVCAMQFIPGERFSEVQPRTPCLSQLNLERHRTFMISLSSFFATSWRIGETHARPLEACTGRVGRTLLSRLETLSQHLPSRALRERAQDTLVAVRNGGLSPLPVTLTHGDLLPTNILIDPQTWVANGYIDWAEAEPLPHGTNLYALEHLLGYLDISSARRPRFVYYAQAAELRETFWAAFAQQIPLEVADDSKVHIAMHLARDVGCLLWHGFAWDDGRIDRVVNRADDGEELAYLEAFLGLEARAARHDSVVGACLEMVFNA